MGLPDSVVCSLVIRFLFPHKYRLISQSDCYHLNAPEIQNFGFTIRNDEIEEEDEGDDNGVCAEKCKN